MRLWFVTILRHSKLLLPNPHKSLVRVEKFNYQKKNERAHSFNLMITHLDLKPVEAFPSSLHQ